MKYNNRHCCKVTFPVYFSDYTGNIIQRYLHPVCVHNEHHTDFEFKEKNKDLLNCIQALFLFLNVKL